MKHRKPANSREMLCGRQPVREVLRAGRRTVFGLWVQQGIKCSEEQLEILNLARRRGAEPRETGRHELDELAEGAHHQGVVVEVSPYPYVDFEDLCAGFSALGEDPLLLLLDHIEDPQNVGSLLRTADAAGFHGVLLPVDRAAEVTPAAVRASSGASEHLRVSRVVNLVRAMNELKELGPWIAGLELGPESRPIAEADLRGPLALVVGSEGHGMGRLVRETCDYLVQIPMHGAVGSLNAGVAGGIAMFEIRRQRRCPPEATQGS